MNLRISAAFAAAAVISTMAGLPADASDSAPEANLIKVQSRTSPLGTHTWYRQTFHGLPVIDGYYAVHELKGEGTRTVDGRQEVPADLEVDPGVESATALTKAASHITAKAAKFSKRGQLKDAAFVPAFGKGKAQLAVYDGKLVWDVVATASNGSTETFVDAATGDVSSSRVLSKNVAGSGSVYAPNPVQKTQNESLVDNNNADSSALTAARKTKTLSHLDSSHTLTGARTAVISAQGGLAQSNTNVYDYTRSDLRFEQVNAYYGVDKAISRLDALGFTKYPLQELRVDTITDDNSFYSPNDFTITYGTGGVDDAEDLDVVWHEFGHAIQDAAVPGFGSSEEAGAIGEGFGDYWAYSMGNPNGTKFQEACIADWDSTAYTSGPVHCLRRVDGSKKYPDDLDGEVHDDGEIWSRALYGIFKTLGRTATDTIVLAGTFHYTPDISMPDAAKCTVKAAGQIYGASVKATVKQKFVARGISGGTCPV